MLDVKSLLPTEGASNASKLGALLFVWLSTGYYLHGLLKDSVDAPRKQRFTRGFLVVWVVVLVGMLWPWFSLPVEWALLGVELVVVSWLLAILIKKAHSRGAAEGEQKVHDGPQDWEQKEQGLRARIKQLEETTSDEHVNHQQDREHWEQRAQEFQSLIDQLKKQVADMPDGSQKLQARPEQSGFEKEFQELRQMLEPHT